MDTNSGGANNREPPSFTKLIAANFALTTALIGTIIVGCSTAFLFGYFSVFVAKMGEIIRLVQYTDVVQFAFTVSFYMVFIFMGFGLLTFELSRRFHHPFIRIDAQTIGTVVITPLAVWFFLYANNYNLEKVALLFIGVIILVCILAMNIGWGGGAFKLHRFIPTLCLTFFALMILGTYFGGTAKEAQPFLVRIGDEKPRSLRLIAALSRGYMFFDPSNNHVLFVPEREVKVLDIEPQQ